MHGGCKVSSNARAVHKEQLLLQGYSVLTLQLCVAKVAVLRAAVAQGVRPDRLQGTAESTQVLQ
jgi:hypothetical protein